MNATIVQPGDLRTIWLIARRGALESLRDRMTLIMSAIWSLAVPFLMVLFVVRPQVMQIGEGARGGLGTLLAVYLLIVGLMPTSGSVGIASGMFAGEKEQGSLLPLLATPASNRAIFGGKVLGAVLPALLYAAIAEVSFVTEIWLLLGANTLRLLPAALSYSMVALVPAEAVLGAAIASIVSSRVRTYQSAQMLSSLAILPVTAALFALVLKMQTWGPVALAIAVVGLIALDALLVTLGAATWRREEVLAKR